MLCRHPAAAGTTAGALAVQQEKLASRAVWRFTEPSRIYLPFAGRQSFSSLPGLHARTQHRHRSAAAAAARANAAQQNDLGSGLQRVVRKVQAALPIVGLFSRLTAAGGGGDGTDDLSYPEYCRALIDAAPAGFNAAVADFGQLYGKVREMDVTCKDVAQSRQRLSWQSTAETPAFIEPCRRAHGETSCSACGWRTSLLAS